MAEVIDTDVQERNKVVEEQKVKDSVPWISRIPPVYWLYAALVWILIFLIMQANKYNPQNIIWVVLATIILFYFMSKGLAQQTGKVLSPDEAYVCLDKNIEQRKKDNRIPRSCKTAIFPDDKLIHDDASPSHYFFGLRFDYGYGHEAWKRATVAAKGDTKGFVTIQHLSERWTGFGDNDDKDKMYILKEWEKQIKKEPGMGIKDLLTRGRQ